MIDKNIKHPLDTRGRGVFLGIDALSQGEWDMDIAQGVREMWLVQEFIPPPVLPAEWTISADLGFKHDLAVAVATVLRWEDSRAALRRAS